MIGSLDSIFLQKLTFTDETLSTLKILGEYKGKQTLFTQQTPEVLNTLLQVSMIESSESSNRIEGITAPHNRIAAIIQNKTQPKNRSEQEIAGYRDALALIHQSAKHMTLTENVILQCHQMLYRYLHEEGGSWKMVDNDIVEKSKNGEIIRIRFKPVSAVNTPQAMKDLVENYKTAIHVNQQEPLVVIPLLILDFLCIHPFTDGNGRTVRLLTLMLLYHFGYEVGRYISLERIFEESKETYYETLEESSKNWHESKHNVHPWLRYFWGTLVRAYEEFEKRVGSIRKGKGSKTDQIRHAVTHKIATFTISDIEKECPGVSRETIRKALRQLRDEGNIKSIGTGRGAKWIKIP